MKFKVNLRKIRRERDITQKQLADKLQVSLNTVSRWERGEFIPTVENLNKLAIILEVTLEQLLKGE